MARSSEPRAARLNPFAFPSDTTFRFVLLIVAVLSASIFAFDWFHTVLFKDRATTQLLRCFERSRELVPDTESLEDSFRRQNVLDDCRAGSERERAAFLLGGAGLVAAAAFGIYLVTPAIKMRRRGLVPMARDEAPGVLERVDVLAREAGLAEVPSVVWNPAEPSADALVFGRKRRYRIALGAPLLVAPPPAFDAVVRHELAHIKNGDVSLTYVANAYWYAFVLVGAIPLLITRATGGGFTWPFVTRFAALVLLVYLVRSALLRSRENYADVRASVWDGPHGELRALVGRLRDRSRGAAMVLSVHPRPAVRLRAIRDPGRLMHASAGQALAAATTATLAISSIAMVFAAFATGTTATTLSQSAASLIVSPFLGACVGIALLRSDFAARAVGARAQLTVWIALAIAGGLLAGGWLDLQRAIEGAALPLRTTLDQLAAVVVLITVWLMLSWFRSATDLWLDTAGSRARPLSLPVLVSSSAIFVWMLALLYSLAFYTRAFGGPVKIGPTDADTTPGIEGARPSLDVLSLLFGYVTSLRTTLAFAALLAIAPPVMVWLTRNRAAAMPEWAWLDPPDDPPMWSTTAPRVRPAIVLGLAGGLLSTACLFAIRLLIRGFASERVKGSTALALQIDDGMTWFAVLVAAVTAFFVAREMRRGAVALCLTAATLSGLIGSVGMVVMEPVLGGTFGWDRLELVIVKVLGTGLFVSLLTGVIANWTKRRVAAEGLEGGRSKRIPATAKIAVCSAVAAPLVAIIVVARSSAPAPEVTQDLQRFIAVGIPLAQQSQVVVQELDATTREQPDPATFSRAVDQAIAQHRAVEGEADRVVPITIEVVQLHDSLVALLTARTDELVALQLSGEVSSLDGAFSGSDERLASWIDDIKDLMRSQGIETRQ